MLQRLDAMESELGALIEALRTGANRLNADLQLLEGNLTDVGEAVAPPRFEPEADSSMSSERRGRAGGVRRRGACRRACRRRCSAAAPTSVDSSAAAETGAEAFGEPVEGHAPPAEVMPRVLIPKARRRRRLGRHRGRSADRAQHGAQRHAARGDRALPGRELRALGPLRRCSTRSTRASTADSAACRRPPAAPRWRQMPHGAGRFGARLRVS